MLVKSLRGLTPKWGDDCFFAENATLIGDVQMGDQCSVWYQAVVRGDVHAIRIGNRVNIQDGAVIHATYQKAATTIGNNVSIGHNAIVHGAHIMAGALIGMGAVVMDNAVVGKGSVVAAGAVVLTGTIIPAGEMWAGSPAKSKGTIKPQLAAVAAATADHYARYADGFRS